MPIDPAITAAMEEAYASAPSRTVWTTMELNHSTFDTPARVILDHGEKLSDNPEVWGRRLRLEADAEVDPGKLVNFISAGISAKRPDFQHGATPTLTLSIDNVSGRLVPLLKRAIAIAEPMKLTMREYLATDPDTVQWRVRGLTVRKASASTVRVEAQATFNDLRERNFSLTYTRERFPTLAR